MSRLYGGLMSDIGKVRNKRGRGHITAYVKSWSGEATIAMDDEDTVRFHATNLNVIVDNQKMFRKVEWTTELLKGELRNRIIESLHKYQRFPEKEWNALWDVVDANQLTKKLEAKND